ncbi:MAG: magnesium-translocating P-type ATPase, partial [Chlamydiae bacterium]|nr:magnesium-translocating P-type ATPase [Chlamydiota bacterium]
MEKLFRVVQINATVIRDRETKKIPLDHTVPGDIVQLGIGDVIPGDCFLLECRNLFVNEVSLTGESFSAEKMVGSSLAETALAKRTNVLFMGTHVVSGSAKALIMQTGLNTEFGKISQSLDKSAPETEFEKGVRSFGYLLLKVSLVFLIAIFALNVYLQRSFMESLLFSLALAVGLTPQLLPAIISINLSKGAKKMATKKVIVKRLSSIEDFGSMNILCSDKTGTLTSGKIQLESALNVGGKQSGKALLFGALNAHFQTGYSNPIDQAILAAAKLDLSHWSKLDEVPYSFERKRLSLLLSDGSESWMITKGAFEQILKICTKVEMAGGNEVDISSLSKDLETFYKESSNKGFRTIGLAYRKNMQMNTLRPEDEQQMTFLGFLLFADALKEHVADDIAKLRELGIDLKVVTGDNRLMAMHLAEVLNISKESILTGEEMQKMDSESLVQLVKEKAIFAEIEPNQKESLILALKKAGNVVGYLGDGINDVTALHAADVSISVDTGADVTKEVADIVLLKKDLSVLQEGVKAGRVTFSNTQKYVFMASSANFGNMFSMAGASLFLNFLPLLSMQILLTNLMEDFPETTIATDHVDPERVLKPVKWNIGFIKKFMIVFGLISSIFDYATFGVLLWLNASIEQFRTGWFVESVVSAAFIVLIVRTFRPFYKSRTSKSLLIEVLS